jgi:hypothetical protein
MFSMVSRLRYGRRAECLALLEREADVPQSVSVNGAAQNLVSNRELITKVFSSDLMGGSLRVDEVSKRYYLGGMLGGI